MKIEFLIIIDACLWKMMLKFSNLRLDDLLAMFVASFVSKQEGAKKAKTSRGWRNCPIFTDDHIKNSVDRSIIVEETIFFFFAC